jgi:hypothetical protein
MATPTQTAANLAAAQQALKDAEAKHAEAQAAVAEPRPPLEVVFDLFAELVSRHGNHPTLEGLLTELGATAKPPATS